MTARRIPLLAVPLLACGGCGGMQSVLDPNSPAASEVVGLWWFMAATGTLIFLGVIALALRAVFARREPGRTLEPAIPPKALVVGGGIVLPLVVLLTLLVYSMSVGRSTGATDGTELEISVTGHQFWWDVRYPGEEVRTANEIHIPTGRPVRIELTSADVIHSFWVPNLAGKMDMIPGRTNTLVLEAERPGVFRGQCAEFCGVQHALMAFLVVAQEPEAFEAWLREKRAPAPEPATAAAARGREVFHSTGCVYCHEIRGTEADGRLGPDLTDIGSRRTLAAGWLANTPENLARWIRDPQSIKPGNLMPATPMPDGELEALVRYLEDLE